MSIVVFILAMVLYPPVMRTVQKELDTVIGFGKVPEFEDRNHLPHCEAILKEVLRWYPIVPGSIPHLSTEDDIYEGYHILAKSNLVANAWLVVILHDAEHYPQPYEFKPEHFLLDKDGNIAKDPGTTGTICPGKNLADTSIWLAVVSLLATFNIMQAINEKGEEIKVDYAQNPFGLMLWYVYCTYCLW
ncbi:hypothetical protein M422DRAFT_194845 [Sphaerobolus stellatus SS14]|uniref:Cytochrome P450 n=1 Tax=Sphaerobolus stellatus (strain SS14) TaxID=990650 RepID=A0A0C9UFR3_SPHS4|nr:hypothetical protein M422DRAFT_194845 [Sphaerobolus stellatus SS14]